MPSAGPNLPDAKPRKQRSRGAGIRQPERTRQAILDAATAEFSSRGLGGARIDAIAKRAGTNKRMIYHYFGNKEAMFLAVLENAYEQIRTMESELHLEEMEPAAAMRKLVHFTFNYFVNNQHFVALLNSENLHRARHLAKSGKVRQVNLPVIDTIAGLLARGEADGSFRAGIDPLDLYITIAALGYFYFSNIHTLSVVFGRDLAAPETTARRSALHVDVILRYLRP